MMLTCGDGGGLVVVVVVMMGQTTMMRCAARMPAVAVITVTMSP